MLTGRRMVLPQELAGEYIELLKTCINCIATAHKAVSELDELLETGFRGDEVEFVQSIVTEVGKIEHHSDELKYQLHQKIFHLESSLPPLDAMFLYRLTDWIGDLADRAEQVANHLELLLAR